MGRSHFVNREDKVRGSVGGGVGRAVRSVGRRGRAGDGAARAAAGARHGRATTSHYRACVDAFYEWLGEIVLKNRALIALAGPPLVVGLLVKDQIAVLLILLGYLAETVAYVIYLRLTRR
jgi:hypothetical protein